ncbi:MAG TPA: hypothetical protein VMU76_13210 [Acidimicrobiales bacterium]|nr:hypothetical protein [Acidimicrobiales bacterium]
MRPVLHPIARPPAALTGPGYDVVLLLHLACVLIGLLTVVVSGVSAARLAAVPPGSRPGEALLRYYAPGTNWAGRAIYGVPVFGLALLAQSEGAFGLGQGWVLGGLLVWVLVAAAAEGLLWPTERRIRSLLAAPGAGPPARAATVTGTAPGEIHRLCRRATGVSAALVVALVVGSVLMVVQP